MATELGNALAQKGHEVHFITYDMPVRFDIFASNLYYHEVLVSNYPLFDYQPYELVLTSKLVDVVKHEKLDLLHVHYAIPHASAAYMARQILLTHGVSIPYITTLHGTDITLVGKDASFEPVITFAINESDAVTAVSQSLKEDTCRYFNVQCEIDVIPNFIDIYKYQKSKNALAKFAYRKSNERILVHTSNFRPVKRVEDVIRVFEKVRKEIPSQLLLVGDGPERSKMEQLCRDLDICDDVQFLGKLKATEQVLSNADLFLLPSETESFGLAALEAMAASVPVISTNTGGIPEINENGFSGFMSDVGDVDDMAANAISILKDDKTLAQFKKNALEKAKTFEIQHILPQYEALYERVLAKNKATS